MTVAGAHFRIVHWAVRRLGTTPEKFKKWERMLVTALLVTVLVFVIRNAGLLQPAESFWLDRMAYADRPEFNAPIVVVAITEQDFYDPELFRGTSPLDPEAVARILERVTEHRPRGVVLDLLIHPAPAESPERAAARSRLYQSLEETAGRFPIILVRDLAAEKRERRADDPNWLAFDRITASPRLVWACPAIQLSGRSVREVPLRYGDQGAMALGLPTVLGAAVDAFGLHARHATPWWAHHEKSDETTPRRIRFSGHFIEHESLVTQHYVSTRLILSRPAAEGSRSLLTDRIVLGGGTFRAGRDTLPTVVGSMAGVCVWAEAVASWIRDDTLREPMLIFGSALEFLVGVLAASLLVSLGPALGLLASILILIPLTIFFSMLTFGQGILFVNFLPSFAGVYLHYQIEVHWEIHNLKRKIRDLERRGVEVRAVAKPDATSDVGSNHESDQKSDPRAGPQTGPNSGDGSSEGGVT